MLEDGTTLFDSRVILEYLDHRAGGGKIIPHEPRRASPRCACRRCADGIIDASILLVYEGRCRPPEQHEQKWIDLPGRQDHARALRRSKPRRRRSTATPDVGQIALACALGYRDFRFAGTWRTEHPKLVAWLDRFAAGAGLCRDQAAGVSERGQMQRADWQQKKPRIGIRGLIVRRRSVIRTER